MNPTTLRQEIRKMRFEETWNEWKKGRLTQEEAGRILGMSERTFRRYLRRVEEEGVKGILDKRLTQASSRRAPVDEALGLVEKYRSRHDGWNVRHFHSWLLSLANVDRESQDDGRGFSFMVDSDSLHDGHPSYPQRSFPCEGIPERVLLPRSKGVKS